MEETTVLTDTTNTNGADGANQQTDPNAPTGGDKGGQTDNPDSQANSQAANPGGDANTDEPQGAPESYEFTAAEGVVFDSGVIDSFSEVAKELNLTQDQAQQVLDKMAPVLQERQVAQLTAARGEWLKSIQNDKEYGGDKLNENLGIAKKALGQFASEEFKTLLGQSGLGDHPEVLRLFYRVGLSMSEDGVVTGKVGNSTEQGAKRIYSASQMN